MKEILTPEALDFVATLCRTFEERRRALLARRAELQAKLDNGWRPSFLDETASIREGDWTVAPIPDDLKRRAVEITGPVDRKMIINALNSGADVFMADLEDSNSPTWANNIHGQINLRDAVQGTIRYVRPSDGKVYALGDQVATLMVRPRGWHLVEKHAQLDGEPVSGSLFDFGLYMFHNAKALVEKGSGPYFYLPKLESHLEARLWNDAFNLAQDELGLPRGTIRATVLIETILAAFEMDEILYELRDHSAGLNCGRWDYIFSFIKKFRRDPAFVMPDRGQVTMDKQFLNAYCELLIAICHKRGIHAMGGMAAQIPIKNDEEANAKALGKVEADKKREVKLGHDGTWVAHPGLIAVARAAFDPIMTGDNQINDERPETTVTAADLLAVPEGTITEAGLRKNVNVGVLYIEAWLGGLGCVPIYNLMEDAATAEISRTQVWQWIHHGASLDDGRTVTATLLEQILVEELAAIRDMVGEARYTEGRFVQAGELFRNLSLAETFVEFLTLPAYEQVLTLS
ncbi:MAG: malate synthase A [Myxococcota bacterium]